MIPVNTNLNASKISYANSYVPNNREYFINKITTEVIDFPKNIFNYKTRDYKTFNYSEICPQLTEKEKIQGYTETDKFIYISSHSSEDGKGSRIYVYDKKTMNHLGFIRIADFDNKDNPKNNAHVGGITYDKDNDILYVTDHDGKIVAYNNKIITNIIEHPELRAADEMKLENNNSTSMQKYYCLIDLRNYTKNKYYKDIHILNTINKDLDMTDDDSNAATVYYYNGILYCATNEALKNGIMKAYKVNTIEDPNTGLKKIQYELLYENKVPIQTQGIAITDYNGKKYMFASQSFFGYSAITTSEILPDGNIKELGIHSYWDYMGMQGIKVNNNGTITGVSEFLDKTIIIPIEKLITNYIIPDSSEDQRLKRAQRILGNIYEKNYLLAATEAVHLTNSFQDEKDLKDFDDIFSKDLVKNPAKTFINLSSEIYDNTLEFVDEINIFKK